MPAAPTHTDLGLDRAVNLTVELTGVDCDAKPVPMTVEIQVNCVNEGAADGASDSVGVIVGTAVGEAVS